MALLLLFKNEKKKLVFSYLVTRISGGYYIATILLLEVPGFDQFPNIIVIRNIRQVTMITSFFYI